MPFISKLLIEIPTNRPFRVEDRLGRALVVIRTATQISAYLDSCPHAFWPLSEGDLHDGLLECPGHGWEFNVENGRCQNAPAYRLTPVSVMIDGDKVQFEWDGSLPQKTLI